MRIDTHVHFWSLARGDYGWLTPDAGALYRDFGADDVLPDLVTHAVDAAILVQAAPTDAETDFLLRTAARTQWIKGVVGSADLASADAVRALARRPLLVGLRPMLQDMPQRDWILGAELTAGLRCMAETRLVFDALIRSDQVKAIVQLAIRHPDLTIVIDHAAKPAIVDRQAFGPWAAAMAVAARQNNVHVKVSGLLTEAPQNATVAQLRPYVDHLVAHFGPYRMLWGSDWPVLTAVSDYASWWALSEELVSGMSELARQAVFGGNAARLYGIGR